MGEEEMREMYPEYDPENPGPEHREAKAIFAAEALALRLSFFEAKEIAARHVFPGSLFEAEMGYLQKKIRKNSKDRVRWRGRR